MVSTQSKPALFNLFHKCWTTPISIIYPFCDGVSFILKGDPALYPHTCLGPVTYMRTVVTKWATQFLAWGSTLHTVEAIKQFVHILNKHCCGKMLLLNTPTKNSNTQAVPNLFHCQSCQTKK
jgi:hypothetical protein